MQPSYCQFPMHHLSLALNTAYPRHKPTPPRIAKKRKDEGDADGDRQLTCEASRPSVGKCSCLQVCSSLPPFVLIERGLKKLKERGPQRTSRKLLSRPLS